jgi:hypothetical protein
MDTVSGVVLVAKLGVRDHRRGALAAGSDGADAGPPDERPPAMWGALVGRRD